MSCGPDHGTLQVEAARFVASDRKPAPILVGGDVHGRPARLVREQGSRRNQNSEKLQNLHDGNPADLVPTRGVRRSLRTAVRLSALEALEPGAIVASGFHTDVLRTWSPS